MHRKINTAFEEIMNENEFQFVMDCDVESLVSFLQEDYHLPLSEAFEKVYGSKIFEKLKDRKTGLYLQSPAYIYTFLTEELHEQYKFPAAADRSRV